MTTARTGCLSTQRLAGKNADGGQMLFVIRTEGQPRNISAAITHDAGADQLSTEKGSAAPPCSTVTREIRTTPLGGISDGSISHRAGNPILALVLPIGQNAKMLGPLKG